MCFGLFGVQIVWGLQNANTSRIFQTLGADVDELAILWIAGPVTGLLLQPIIGRWSDGTWTRLGRRRPFILYGAILAALALLVMPNADRLVFATLMLWMLCAAINIAMEPFRALIADTVPEGQRTSGFAIQVFFIGTGAVLASALPWMLTNWFGISNDAAPGQLPPSVHWAFYIGAILLVVAVGWTVATSRERPPETLARAGAGFTRPILGRGDRRRMVRSGLGWSLVGLVIAAAAWSGGLRREIYIVAAMAAAFGAAQLLAAWLRQRGRKDIGSLEIVEDIFHMPEALRKLAVVQFFTWFGLFAMWIYTTPAVTARYFHAEDASAPGYNAGADWVGILFAGYNAVAAIAALLLPLLVKQLGRRAAHALCLTLGGLGFAGFLLLRDPRLLWIPTVGIGIAWASILSIPYAILSSAVPPEKMGVYMGIHNLFLVIPQLVAATILGPLVHSVFQGQALYALALAAIAFLLAAAAAFAIPPRPDR